MISTPPSDQSIAPAGPSGQRPAWEWATWRLGILALVALLAIFVTQPRLQLRYVSNQLATIIEEGQTQGFYSSQRDEAGNYYVWTQSQAAISFDFQVNKPLKIDLELRSAAIAGGPDAPIRVLANGHELAQIRPDPKNPDFQTFNLKFTPPPAELLSGLKLEILSMPFQPPKDRRLLGTMVKSIAVDKTEAWSGLAKRMWLFGALPVIGLAAIGLGWVARRFRLAIAGYGAMGLCIVGMSLMGLALLLLLRIGSIHFVTFGVWLIAIGYLGGLFWYAALRLPLGSADAPTLSQYLLKLLQKSPPLLRLWQNLTAFGEQVRRLIPKIAIILVFGVVIGLALIAFAKVGPRLSGPQPFQNISADYEKLQIAGLNATEHGILSEGLVFASLHLPLDKKLAIVANYEVSGQDYFVRYWLYPRPFSYESDLAKVQSQGVPSLIILVRCKNADCAGELLPQPVGYTRLYFSQQGLDWLGIFQKN